MLVGVPKEIKDNEFRVGIIPATIEELVRRGHQVVVETGAGRGAGLEDGAYAAAGATIAPSAADVFDRAELIVKVKEPLAAERNRLKRGQVLFTYLHLAADPEQAEELLASGVTAIAYETVTGRDGKLPLLTPMSEVAGRMAPQVGAHCLEKVSGGRGVLLGGVPGVPPADVLILGSGVVGTNAAMIAIGMGADVIMAGRNVEKLRRISACLGSLRTVLSTGAKEVLWVGHSKGGLTLYGHLARNPQAPVRAAVAMGADETALFRKVVLPGSLPFVITGLRQAFARSWIAVVGGEMIAASAWGLGWVLFDAKEFLNTDVMLGTLVVIGGLGLLFERVVFQPLEARTVERWGLVIDATKEQP